MIIFQSRITLIILLISALFHSVNAQHHSSNLQSNEKFINNPPPFQNTNQDNKSSTEDKPRVRFGLKLGANLSNMNFNRGYPKPANAIETSWYKGFAAGLFMQVPINDKFFIQPEYSYSQMGGKIKSTGVNYKLDYISLPVLLKYNIASNFSLVIGPQFDLLIQAKESVNGNFSDMTRNTEERSIGATAGIEFQFLKHLSINARYMNGLNHIGIGQRSNIKEFKYELFQLSLDFKL